MKVEITHLKILTFYSYYHIHEMKSELKYFQSFEKIQFRKANIIKAIYKE